MPVGEAPHRPMPDDPGGEVRLRMCELAAANDDRLSVSRLELDRPGPSYTVDTLRDLRARRPDEELVFLLGGDQARALPEWHEPEEVLRLAEIAATERDRHRREEIRAAVADLAGPERLTFFDMPRIDVSSSLVRRRVAEGRPIRYLVPEAVATFIAEHELYRSPARVTAA